MGVPLSKEAGSFIIYLTILHLSWKIGEMKFGLKLKNNKKNHTYTNNLFQSTYPERLHKRSLISNCFTLILFILLLILHYTNLWVNLIPKNNKWKFRVE